MSDQDIFTAEVEARVREGAHLYDVREPGEYQQGHIPGAVNVPLRALAARAGELQTPAVLVCLGGGRSAQAAGFLAAEGRSGLMSLAGGTMGWMRAERELRAGLEP